MKRLLINIILLLVAVATGNNVFAQTVDSNYLDGEIYVKYKDDFPVDFSREFVEPHTLPGLNTEIVSQFGIVEARFSFNKVQDIKLQKTVRLKFTAIKIADNLVDYFASQSFIEYAEKIPAYRPTYVPNDLGPNTLSGLWHLYTIQAREAWDYTIGDTNIVVAVVDQECNISHTDLKDNIWKNPGEIPNNGIDDDNNGYIDDVSGWDMSDNDNNVVTTNTAYLDHGTPCAGLVSATTDNGTGVASIGFSIKILPVKVSKETQTDNLLRNTSEGIVYSALIGAEVISCSFGSNTYSQTQENTINYAFSQNCIVVASAGNDNNTLLGYPASYAGVISVAATYSNDKKASFSNYGSRIDVSAPGVGVGTTRTNGSYYLFSGTSAACPLTAGLLGLMKSYQPLISNSDIKACLMKSCDNTDSVNQSYIGLLGAGRINAENAMKCLDSVKIAPPKLIIKSEETLACPNKSIKITSSAANKNLDSIVWYLPGAIILSKSNLDIEVKYPVDGVYSIGAVGYNQYGKDSVFLQDFLTVNSLYTSTFYFEDFENPSSYNNLTIINPDNNITWIRARALTTASSGNTAMKMDFYNYTTPSGGARDAFISPPINLSHSLKPQLTFSHSYSKLGSLSDDSLIVSASLDSGKTFPYRVLAVNGLSLVTAFSAYNFEPQNNSECCFGPNFFCNTLTMDSVFARKSHVQLKFETYHKIGNNLYIDNIKVFSKCEDVLFFPPITDFDASKTDVCQGDKIHLIIKVILLLMDISGFLKEVRRIHQH